MTARKRNHDWLALTVEEPLEPDLRPAPPPVGRRARPPYYEYTIEKFGADRCMFESNFPVDAASCSYTALWNSF